MFQSGKLNSISLIFDSFFFNLVSSHCAINRTNPSNESNGSTGRSKIYRCHVKIDEYCNQMILKNEDKKKKSSQFKQTMSAKDNK